MGKRPAAIDLASWLLWIQVLAGLVVSVLVVIFREDLREAWSPGASGDSTVQPLEFVPVILVLYGVIALTTLTLIPMMRSGHNWSRHALAMIEVGILIATIATVRTMPPAVFRGLIIVAAVLAAVTLVFIWHPESRRHCRELEAAADGADDEVEVVDLSDAEDPATSS
ncbi:hypothetical protein DJ010_05525 [Nocardioides silvaticus]|uniref:Uncharacterized protein n=1 Tax=Nocardioides silvaticus TaxID=2201891 RepID=A0A316TIE7_9ACTN|nr:hypothetical protein [Nocardioides silvaticus]PWN03568.1 hypothetical protein DJ010_05525 [Nocardioides silvaticus]